MITQIEELIKLARLHFEANRLDDAAKAMESAIALNPPNIAACCNNLGVIYDRARNYSAAAGAYRRAIQLRPGYSIAHKNLGDALRQLGEFDQAVASYQKSILQNPGFAPAYAGWGLLLYQQNHFRRAIEKLSQAVRLDPQDSGSYANLSLCHARLAEHDDAINAARRAVQINPNDAELHSNLIALMNYTQGDTPGVILAESQDWDRRHGQLTDAVAQHSNDRNINRPLRIGFISPDFRNHSVGYFFEPALTHRDRSSFIFVCYSNVESPDDFTQRMRASADLWREIQHQSDDQVAQQIREDRIDILIDLAGHSVNNRLLVLAQQPAPIQVTWLGYPNTTGMKSVHYRFTDAWADPPGANDSFYSEKLVRLPETFCVYQAPADAPVSDLPAKTNGYLTFGMFNQLMKITDAAMDLWSSLLRNVPDARVLIVGVSLEQQQRAGEMFQSRGIDMDRLAFAGRMSLEEYFKSFSRVDVCLDTFPWAGHTTTCHSLWMGVPVLSLAGQTAVSRAGMSVMGNLGLEIDWVAGTPEKFVSLGESWAARIEELAKLRSELRGRMQQSPLVDATKFMQHFQGALRSIWKDWCESPR